MAGLALVLAVVVSGIVSLALTFLFLRTLWRHPVPVILGTIGLAILTFVSVVVLKGMSDAHAEEQAAVAAQAQPQAAAPASVGHKARH